jgi:hypothetical protein
MPTHSYDTEVYYKILIPTPKIRNQMKICTLQDFDEYHYVESEWLADDDGVVSFDTEQEARQYLADHVDDVWICDADRLPKSHVSNWKAHHHHED